ncbi:TIGR03084 family metal-binding protein [Pseudonocardia eucalypti]|uniref:TIGR03084 family metal-binding protein n=1 Tax=Pseudonocardia eucalypti TaxID=648755 RepID=A0ABP9R6Y6_9PSEU|nr:uncharacterized protein (TIGR03084 family) [Pseudonocardia eucalypti]
MAVNIDHVAGDLAEETAELRAVLAGLDPGDWERPTPSEGWAIRDQVSHLAYFDEQAVRSTTEPERFAAEARRLVETGELDPDKIAAQYRDMPAAELLTWFDTARAELIEVFGRLDPAVRVPWYGPPMSAVSSLTARLMETWAHGQDVFDTVGASRAPTARLRHVAHIGVRALPFSYLVRGLAVPEAPVWVELAAPDGQTWTWGPADAENAVRGPALDFCLLVTQRRHLDDLTLEVTGPVATEWTSFAQAFAGAPGPGRPPLS